MADSSSPLHLSKIQALESPSPRIQQFLQQFSTNFLHKAIFVSVVIALLSLFPSRAPEIVNQSILARTWELLHLLFVGITISYGLFSRRNADFDAGKEASLKAENTQSYLSHMLHVSSVFDDNDEFYSLQGALNETKTQTWSSRYHRNDPVVVIANGSCSSSSHASSRPLFLPVRSLKSHIQAVESPEEIMDSQSSSISEANETVDSRDSTSVQGETASWRSRLGKMEMNDEAGMIYLLSSSLPPSAFDGHSNLSKTSSFRSSKTPSPKRPSLSRKMRAKSSEDVRDIRTFYEFSPPPAPPTPPPFTGHGYPDKKVVRKSFKDELKDLSRRVRKSGQSSSDIVFDLFESVPKPKDIVDGSSVGRSCRTVRVKDVQGVTMDGASKMDSEQFSSYETQQSQSLSKIHTEKRNELMEKMVSPPAVNSDKEEEDDDDVAVSTVKEEVLHSAAQAGANGNEVDKKADEFIAKFRKQITLQRFESGQQPAKC